MKRSLTLSLLCALIFCSCGHKTVYEPPFTLSTVERTEIAVTEASTESESVTEALTETVDVTEALTEPPVTEPEPEPYETARISFVVAGDNVIHPCVYIDARNRAKTSGTYNFRPMYDDVDEYIAGFDLAFINQETLMGGEGLGYSGYPRFNSPQDLGRDLRDMGFDIINIANNHMCDKSEEGLAGTIEFFESEEMSEITLIGGYKNAEDYDNIRVVERDGVRLAFLSYTYETNGLRLPKSSEYVVPYINDEDILRQTALAEEVGDLTVVSVHWGNENSTKVSAEQRRVAQLLAENGADVILGHHPHVLQPIEWIETERGQTLCIYSLGNLVSAMMYWENMVGGFLNFDIVKMSDGGVYVENVQFVPTAFYYGPNNLGTHLYFLCDYPAEKAKNHGTGTIYNSPATPSDMVALAERIMGDHLVLDPFGESNEGELQ